jgi:hypothetical protein
MLEQDMLPTVALDDCIENNLDDAKNSVAQSETKKDIRKGLDHKKQNGIFYTPDAATHLLAGWAIRKPTDLVLEPSFGGCGFLDAALERFQQLGATASTEQLYGCDVDSRAFEHLQELLPNTLKDSRFKKQDFLSVALRDFCIAGVDAVIGNPPYVSWHTMLAEQRVAAGMITTPAGHKLRKKGSLWAFFVVHSLSFMKQGGRMAWILPSGFLHADYSQPLRDIVASYFDKTLAVSLDERLFLDEGTEESSVILLCEGFQSGRTEPMRLTAAKNLHELSETIGRWTLGESVGQQWNQHASLLLAAPHVAQCYSNLTTSEHHRTLSQLIKIKIGLVTGDNKFFVINQTQAKDQQLPAGVLKPIIARLVHFSGLEVRAQDLENLVESGARCLLIDTTGAAPQPSLTAYLNSYPTHQRSTNYTFSKRPVWHQVNDELNPDAFFSSMSSQGPVLLLNGANTTCTNTVYRVWFSSQASTVTKRYVALSLQSTFSQFSAEVVGRNHGSSALKLEPSEVLRLGLLLPTTPVEFDTIEAYRKVDAQLRLSNLDAARKVADEFLIAQGLLTPHDNEVLEAGLLALRATRQRKR